MGGGCSGVVVRVGWWGRGEGVVGRSEGVVVGGWEEDVVVGGVKVWGEEDVVVEGVKEGVYWSRSSGNRLQIQQVVRMIF